LELEKTLGEDFGSKDHKPTCDLASYGIAALHAKGVTIIRSFFSDGVVFLPVREPEVISPSQIRFFSTKIP